MNDELSPAQVRQLEDIVRLALREALADAGLRLDGGDQQDQAREDFRFIRRLRLLIDGTASKIGYAIIAAFIGGGIWIFTQGLNIWKGGP